MLSWPEMDIMIGCGISHFRSWYHVAWYISLATHDVLVYTSLSRVLGIILMRTCKRDTLWWSWLLLFTSSGTLPKPDIGTWCPDIGILRYWTRYRVRYCRYPIWKAIPARGPGPAGNKRHRVRYREAHDPISCSTFMTSEHLMTRYRVYDWHDIGIFGPDIGISRYWTRYRVYPISGMSRYRDTRYRVCPDIGIPDIGTCPDIGCLQYRTRYRVQYLNIPISGHHVPISGFGKVPDEAPMQEIC